ncbi:ribosomal protein S5 domain 2-like protein [Panus rudis PR-1116 ss-1]|nr:ribosomal protein S5 domain 2-like protein [Panus rudis PR-1116 ss-1]
MSNLHNYITTSRPPPTPLFTSQDIRDRGSTFTAHIFRSSSPIEAQKAISHLKNVIHASRPATHEIAAWRCMALKAGKTGLGGPDDFELVQGYDDDGEKYAGSKVLKIMQAERVIDAVVVVSRWFGGEMLGPSRFDHIETCAREVCRAFTISEELEGYITTLTTLDSILATLRDELAELRKPSVEEEGEATSSSQPKEKEKAKREDYASLKETKDLKRAKRLVTARENSIKSVKAMIKKLQDQQKANSAETTANK